MYVAPRVFSSDTACFIGDHHEWLSLKVNPTPLKRDSSGSLLFSVHRPPEVEEEKEDVPLVTPVHTMSYGSISIIFCKSEDLLAITTQSPGKYKKVTVLQKDLSSTLNEAEAMLLPGAEFLIPTLFEEQMRLLRLVEALAVQFEKYSKTDLNPLCVCDSLSARVLFFLQTLWYKKTFLKI